MPSSSLLACIRSVLDRGLFHLFPWMLWHHYTPLHYGAAMLLLCFQSLHCITAFHHFGHFSQHNHFIAIYLIRFALKFLIQFLNQCMNCALFVCQDALYITSPYIVDGFTNVLIGFHFRYMGISENMLKFSKWAILVQFFYQFRMSNYLSQVEYYVFFHDLNWLYYSSGLLFYCRQIQDVLERIL